MSAGSAERTRILVVGGGYVGMYTALRLQRRLRSELKAKKVEIIVVDPRSYMTYQPFLPEAAAGSVEPRHVVVPLRRVLRQVRGPHRPVRLARPRAPGRAHPADPRRGVRPVLRGGRARARLDRAHAADPGPGRAGHRLQAGRGGHRAAQPGARPARHRHERHRPRGAAASCSPSSFVGGGYAGIEALAELEDMARYATRYYPDLSKGDIRFVLVEATGRILPEVGEDLGRYTVERAAQARRSTYASTPGSSRASTATSCSPTARSSTPRPSSGPRASRPTRCSRETGLPLDDKGRLRCRADLRVEGVDGRLVGGRLRGGAGPDRRPGRD